MVVAVMSICSRNVTIQDRVYPKVEEKVGRAPVVVPMPIYMQPLDMCIQTLKVILIVDNLHILTQLAVVDRTQDITVIHNVHHKCQRLVWRTHRFLIHVMMCMKMHQLMVRYGICYRT